MRSRHFHRCGFADGVEAPRRVDDRFALNAQILFTSSAKKAARRAKRRTFKGIILGIILPCGAPPHLQALEQRDFLPGDASAH
jgi:hypothetical protein